MPFFIVNEIIDIKCEDENSGNSMTVKLHNNVICGLKQGLLKICFISLRVTTVVWPVSMIGGANINMPCFGSLICFEIDCFESDE